MAKRSRLSGLLAGSILTFSVVVFFGCEPRWIGPRRIDTWNGIQNAYVCLDLPSNVVGEASVAVNLWDKVCEAVEENDPCHWGNQRCRRV